MGDSALWESELLRARQWLAAQRRDKQQENERIFQRVKAHITYTDHQMSLQSEATASDDDDDMALDFLGDVDAADMNALLQAEAAKAAASVPAVETVTPVVSSMPSAGDLLQPLEMPTNLASPKLKSKPVPMSQLDPKIVSSTRSTTTSASATLGDDAAVQELMQVLQVDVPHHSDSEETKTEESTPPHLLKNFGGNANATSNGASFGQSGAGGKAEQSKYMHQVSSKSPHKKKMATPATTKPNDDVAAEMQSWVSGYRDPDVVRRKENMARRKRKHPHRFGVSSEEEQRQVLMKVKQITHDNNSESDSENDFSSDYSPAEDDEVPEPEEPEVVDLLSDDYLDSDEDKRPVQQKRKRLRQAKSTQKKKKSRSRKPVVTRKVAQRDSTSTQSHKVEDVQPSVVAAAIEADHKLVANNRASMDESDDVSTSNSNQPIELLSSGDEAGEGDNDSIPEPVEHMPRSRIDSGGSSGQSAESDAINGSTILRSKDPKRFQRSQIQEGGSNKHLQKPAPRVAEFHTLLKPSGSAENEVGAPSELSTSESVAGARTRQSESNGVLVDNQNTLQQQPVDANADDSDLSDTGTVDLEGEDLSIENDDHSHDAENTPTGEAAGSGTGKDAGANPGDNPNLLDNNTNAEAQQSGELDEDVSEAETEILEDDEPDTDDLGLEYSDDSDPESNPGGDKKHAAGGNESAARDKNDATADNKSSASSTGNTGAGGHGNSGKTPNGEREGKTVDSSTAGVQQFFDFAPLKLKPKAKSTTTTAPKPLPMHNYAETHLKKGSNDTGKVPVESKNVSAAPTTKSSGGSNGLRPSKKPIATSSVLKGKYVHTRRSTKMLDRIPGAKEQSKGRYTMVPTQKTSNDDDDDFDDMPLLMQAIKQKEPGSASNARYLSYAGAKKTEDAPTYVAETPRIVPKSRFGGGGVNLIPPASQVSPATPNGQHSQVNDKNAPRGGYRREPQISIYAALDIDGQENASDIREGTSYKRPSRFKKMQAEAARNGTPMVKSRMQDTDWDKVPIPKKKKKQVPQVEKLAQDALPKASNVGGHGSRNAMGKTQNKRRKKTSGPSNKNAGPSYYGPNTSQSGADKRKRSLSPPARDRDRDRHKRDGRFRDHRRPRAATRDRGTKAGRQPLSPNGCEPSSKKDTSTTSDAPELGEVFLNGRVGDVDRSTKKQKISQYTEAPTIPGALSTFDDDDDNVFISDSDNDGNKEVEDIRFNLESVLVDEALMSRQVYVTGLNPSVCAEHIEEDFARFGVAVERDTGFPAIDIFPCQRNHLGRGDACVTFETEEGALEAVEELNSKNVKNSMIHVRRMDVHTQRILTVQFQMIRDTWKCNGSQCRADVSVWNAKCDMCGRKRVYAPSNIKIGAESWLCSLCFTANDSFATSCHGCKESLPEVDRSTFYSSL
ncbi:uncharacterized protein KRP23_14187 [Phytophthora ramorum]|uniref:uncharacterized protein n=1 Tax=Phytophthora ramorum TaxID=164328 RepID=UPI0030A3173E|nr:hypothetical protein KRP23_14187 [Phytophthora ramorum]